MTDRLVLFLCSLRPGLRTTRFGGALLLAALGAGTGRAQTGATPYFWTTLAGSAGTPLTRVDATGTAARFYWPFGVAVDGAGNVIVADSYNGAIRKVTPSGAVTTVASGFNNPEGVAVDSAGSIFFADTFSNVVRKITATGVVSTVAGTAGTAGFADGLGATARLNSPRGIAVDRAGNVFVADSGNHIVRKLDALTGNLTTFAGLPTTSGSNDGNNGSARFNQPWGLAIDAAGNLFVTDYGNATIRRITPAGDVSTLAGTVGSTGTADGTGAAARFSQPGGIAADNAGSLFVADTFNHTIRKITSAGVVTTIGGKAGQPGAVDGLAGTAAFSSPSGIAVDAAGALYVADQANSTIRSGIVPRAPSIAAQPQNLTVTAGVGATFSVATSSPVPVTYQWLFNGSPMAGATAATLAIGSAQARDAGNYAVMATNLAGSTLSAAATLTVSAPPSIATAPNGTIIGTGGTATLAVAAVGSGALSYQWLRDGAPVTGATAATLTTDVAGSYTVSVTNAFGTVTTTPVRVEFPNRLINLSTRGTVGTGSGVFIAGFVVQAPPGATKSLLVRGVGPALTGFGVGGAVAQTAISLANARGEVVATNQGWSNNSNLKQLVDTTLAVGAFPLTPASGDSAVTVNLAAGNYTVTVTGVGGATGTGLVEVYEAGADNSRLVNLSTRGVVSAGSNLMTGVIVQGPTAAKLLVRAIGPGLAQFGVTGALARPQLTVFNGPTTLASNAGWSVASSGSTPAAVTEAAAAAGAFPLAAGSDDAALVLTNLAPGIYTATVTGVAGATGAALIEVYQMP